MAGARCRARAPAFAELAELGARASRHARRSAGCATPHVRWSLRELAIGAARRSRRCACAGWRCSRAGSAASSIPTRRSATTRLDDRSVADFCRVYLGRRALDQLLAPLFETLLRARGREHEPRSSCSRCSTPRGRARARPAARAGRAGRGARGAARPSCAAGARVARLAADGRVVPSSPSGDRTRVRRDRARGLGAPRRDACWDARSAPADARPSRAFASSRRSCSRSRRTADLALADATSLWFAARDGGELAGDPRAARAAARCSWSRGPASSSATATDPTTSSRTS